MAKEFIALRYERTVIGFQVRVVQIYTPLFVQGAVNQKAGGARIES